MKYTLKEETIETITAPEVLEILRWFYASQRDVENGKPPIVSVSEDCYKTMTPQLRRHFKKGE